MGLPSSPRLLNKKSLFIAAKTVYKMVVFEALSGSFDTFDGGGGGLQELLLGYFPFKQVELG